METVTVTKRPATYTFIAALSRGLVGPNLVVRALRGLTPQKSSSSTSTAEGTYELLVGDASGSVLLLLQKPWVGAVRDMLANETYPALVLRNVSVTGVNDGSLRVHIDQFGRCAKWPDGVASTPSPCSVEVAVGSSANNVSVSPNARRLASGEHFPPLPSPSPSPAPAPEPQVPFDPEA